jgi:glycosyltransferase involved in cell wall biosynthesis
MGLRVLHVMLSGGLGGVQAAFANYSALLCELGHQTICCVAPNATVLSHLTPKVQVVTLSNKFERDPLAIYRAVRMLKTHKPDVVLVHGKRALVIFAAARRFAGLNIPLVNVLHRHRFKGIDMADMSICVSKRLCDDAAMHGIDRRKLAHVPNFIPELWPSTPTRQWRDPPVIGFVGRLVPEKGADILIEAARLLKEQGVKFKIQMGGDGELRGELMALAAQHGVADLITWLGWIDDVPGFYDAVDICCVPSRWESFGIVVLHALNAGKTLLATRTVGPSEIITDGRNGLLCDVSPADVAAKLKLLIEDRELAFRLASRGHEERQVYTLEAVAPQVDAILRDAVRELTHAEAAIGSSVIG